MIAVPRGLRPVLRRRFLHWVNVGAIQPASVRGDGTGKRREYDIDAIRFAALLLSLSRWMDGEKLQRAAAGLREHLKALADKPGVNVLEEVANGDGQWLVTVEHDGHAAFQKHDRRKWPGLAQLASESPGDFLVLSVARALRSVRE
jgi:hypothetical protein